MKNLRKHWSFLFGTIAGLGLASAAWSQSLPGLVLIPVSDTQFYVALTNSGTGNYDLWKTPLLGNPAYPWQIVAVTTHGSPVFLVTKDLYPSEFYRIGLDTNLIPLWMAANPTNQSLGWLNVWIDSPTNGSSLTQ